MPRHNRFEPLLFAFLCREGILLLPLIALLVTAEFRSLQADDFTDSTTRIRHQIELLASPEFAGRRGVNAQKAAVHIAAEFRELQLVPVFPEESFLQEIPGSPTAEGEKTVAGWNVAACLPGSDPALAEEFVLIAAHHDHLGQGKRGIYAGADDNASGVAMVLEAARKLSQATERPKRSVLFVSFDLEEHLLFGSRWFVAHPPIPVEKIRFVVVADMLGRSLGDMPLNSFFVFGSEHAAGIQPALQDIAFPATCRPVFLSDDIVGTRSDYAPFRDLKIPFVFVSTGQSRDYHTVRDTADKINFEQVSHITAGLAELLELTANAETPPEWIENPPLQMQEVEAVLTITRQIEALADDWNLSVVQRMFVAQTRKQAEKILQQNEIGEQDHAWLTRSTQMLLLTVF